MKAQDGNDASLSIALILLITIARLVKTHHALQINLRHELMIGTIRYSMIWLTNQMSENATFPIRFP